MLSEQFLQFILEDDEDYLQMTACLQGLTERYDENGVAADPPQQYSWRVESPDGSESGEKQTELHSQVNERLWCGNTPALSIDRCLLWSYTEVMKKEKMITEPSPGHLYSFGRGKQSFGIVTELSHFSASLFGY